MSTELAPFWSLCSRIEEMWDADGDHGYGSEPYQRTLDEIVAWVEAHPRLRPQIVELFVQSVRANGDVPDPVIEHTMRKLRWPEVYQAARDFAAAHDPRHMNRLSHILQSFDEPRPKPARRNHLARLFGLFFHKSTK
jgi:hypothetical protein